MYNSIPLVQNVIAFLEGARKAYRSDEVPGSRENGIVKTAILVPTTTQQPFLCAYDNDSRISFRTLRRALRIPKREDIRFYHGNLEELVGAANGNISPFVDASRLSHVYFDRSLLENAAAHPDRLWHMPPLYANPADVYQALMSVDAGKYAELTVVRPEG